jgi:cytochrome b6
MLRERLKNLRIGEWLEARYPIRIFLEWGRHKEVPQGRFSAWYFFGGSALFLFTIQVITGILLMFYYKASADTAFESVQFITAKVPFGWLIRSIHSWSANLMVLALFIHMFSVFFMGAYRKPRELTWVSGMLLLFIALGFGFSGYLLPWNELSFFATKVGTDMIGKVPGIGIHLLRIMRGGDEVTGSTLPRFFALHVAVFPFLLTSLILFHLILIQIQGMHEPDKWKERPQDRKMIPFFPHFFLKEALVWLIVLDVLAILAVFFPWEVGKKADPFASAPAGIRPEWYFMWMFQTLKFLPAKIGPIDGELIGLFGVSAVGLAWFLLPWIDRRESPKFRRGLRIAGVVAVIYILIMTYLGYHLE